MPFWYEIRPRKRNNGTDERTPDSPKQRRCSVAFAAAWSPCAASSARRLPRGSPEAHAIAPPAARSSGA